MFCIYLRTNSDLCHLLHKMIGFYNRDEKCLLLGTNWVFNYSSLRFVFKGLITVRSRASPAMSGFQVSLDICMIRTDVDLPVIISLSLDACVSVHTVNLFSVVVLFIFLFLRFFTRVTSGGKQTKNAPMKVSLRLLPS